MKIATAKLKVPRMALALGLVFWMAGLGCVLGCESFAMNEPGNGAARATDDKGQLQTQQQSHLIVSGDACAAHAEHSCCAKHRSAPAQLSNRTSLSEKNRTQSRTSANLAPAALEPMGAASNETMRECPLALNATALVTKARADESTIPIRTRAVTVPLIAAANSTIPSAPGFLNNRGRTYLRCCVFLI